MKCWNGQAVVSSGSKSSVRNFWRKNGYGEMTAKPKLLFFFSLFISRWRDVKYYKLGDLGSWKIVIHIKIIMVYSPPFLLFFIMSYCVYYVISPAREVILFIGVSLLHGLPCSRFTFNYPKCFIFFPYCQKREEQKLGHLDQSVAADYFFICCVYTV